MSGTYIANKLLNFLKSRLQMTIKCLDINGDLKKIIRISPSQKDGQGVYAKTTIKKGQYIGEYKGPYTSENGKYVLWVEEDHGPVGRDGKNALKYLNHSINPNAEFDGFLLFAIRDIAPHEEITIDYGDDSFDFYYMN